MSRQYLKQLQYRAQKLLEVSSDEDDGEEVNAYTATNGRTQSPRADFNHFIHDQQPSTYQIGEDEDNFGQTDVQLLKKCLQLTNENSSLKQRLEKRESQNQELKKEIVLRRQSEKQLKSIIEQKIEMNKQTSNERSGKQYISLEREWELIERQKGLIAKQYEAIERERMQLKRQTEHLKQLQNMVRLKQNKEQQNIHDINTIKLASEQEHRLKYKYEQSQQRSQRLETMLRQQKAKLSKMCQFVNKELPLLKDALVQMTTKLEVKVDKYLLKNIYD